MEKYAYWGGGSAVADNKLLYIVMFFYNSSFHISFHEGLSRFTKLPNLVYFMPKICLTNSCWEPFLLWLWAQKCSAEFYFSLCLNEFCPLLVHFLWFCLIMFCSPVFNANFFGQWLNPSGVMVTASFNSFTSELPITARADPGPFHRLWHHQF